MCLSFPYRASKTSFAHFRVLTRPSVSRFWKALPSLVPPGPREGDSPIALAPRAIPGSYSKPSPRRCKYAFIHLSSDYLIKCVIGFLPGPSLM